MLRQFLTSLAMIGAYATAVGSEEKAPDIATWRWHVDGILEVQRADAPLTIGDYDFRQQYERFTANGMPEPPRGPTPRP